MPCGDDGDVTLLLRAVHAGEPGALDRLVPRIYEELRRLAQGLMRGERKGHTLQPTVLVHEAWLKLVRQDSVGFAHRAEFFSAAATVMRRILIDHARERARGKRDAGGSPALDEAVRALEDNAGSLLALGAALDDLTRLDPRKAKLVELRFFVGLGMREASELLAVHQRQAERDWTAARAWLRRRLSANG
jgi:RNA polymerase sigma factor (TIGR02999 family)